MKYFVLNIFLMFSWVLIAQNQIIEGYVKDSGGALAGVTIHIEGTRIGTTSNLEGYYRLTFAKNIENPIVVFSFIGKKTQKIAYKGISPLNIELKDDLLALDEVQVYAKTNINALDIRTKTGNVETISMAEIKDIPLPNIALALQGKILGLQVINQGELGTLPQIRIRGTSSLRRGDVANEPLYILDGKMIPAETFFYLNPEDIREMKVLKDAVASALYGIKAANGVIEITSKRGGEKSLSFHTQSGVTFATPAQVRMMNSAEKLELERLLQNPNTPGYKYSEEYITKQYAGQSDYQERLAEGVYKLDSLKNINTDWYRELSSMQTFQKYDVSFRKGNEKTAYLASLGYMQQGGQLQGNDLSRISSQLAIDQTLSQKAIVTLSVNGAYSKTRTPNGGSYSPEQLIYDLNPYETKQTREFYSYPKRNFQNLFNQFRKESTYKSLGTSLSINWKVTSGLEISAVTGIDFSLGEVIQIIPETAFSETDKGKPIYARGHLEQAKNTLTSITSNVRINYEKTFGKHQLTLGGNADNYTTIIDNLFISGNGLFGQMHSASSVDNSLSGIYASKVGGRKQTERNIGFGSIVGYTYNNIYDLFATYKADASSVLPVSKRWNSAWAIGAGINFKSYSWFEKISWLTALQIRGSFGQTANAQGINPSLITTTFKYNSINYDNIRLIEVMELPNENLRAEQNQITDIGISATLWKTSLHATLYRRTTKDALLSIPIASSSGFSHQLQNIGILENKGIEWGVTQTAFSNKNWNVRLGISMSYNENKVVDLYDGRERIYTGDAEDSFPDYEVGQPIDALYGLHSLGINPVTGLPDFLNKNQQQIDIYTTKLSNEDFVYLGKSTPPYNGSFFLSVAYKKLFFDMNFYYTLGGVKSYANNYIRNSANANLNAAQNQLNDMWWKVGDEYKKYPTAFYPWSVGGYLNQPNTRTIARTDFIRLSSISIKYQLDTQQLSHFAKSLRYMTIGITAANIATFTRYKGNNPESDNIINPLPATITLNLNLNF